MAADMAADMAISPMPPNIIRSLSVNYSIEVYVSVFMIDCKCAYTVALSVGVLVGLFCKRQKSWPCFVSPSKIWQTDRD